MLNILKDHHFIEYYTTGFVETGIFLPDSLVEEIKQYYQTLAVGRNDFPKFFVNNEHLAFLEGQILGTLFKLFPKLAKKMVKSLYDKTYTKAIYHEQVFLEKVCKHLLANGFQKIFKTRYLLASYDMYLRSNTTHTAAGIHSDMPNFHHFYETENDLSIYIPLIDLNEENGGRITVLPESQLKVPGNIVLALMEQHFSKDANHLDENGYIVPESIRPDALNAFIKSKPFQEIMACYKSLTHLAKHHYAGNFEKSQEEQGKVLLWNNKNFHAAEGWKREDQDREVYVIRLFPLYDTKIKLKESLHGKLFNNHLIDFETGEIHKFDHQVDVSQLPKQDKLALA
ncbi:MAG: hypothetical protein Q7U57_18115 [Methylovulum sp.]|nr:hypothetical protein [Methylovulum sp.]